jgi:dGTP triphosphohydrolase
MATPWPQQPAWPTPFREHATRLSTYLQDALTCIDRTQSQPVPADLVKVIIHGTLTFILKVQHAPDLSTVCDALSILQTEAKASSDNAAQMLEAAKHELKNELKNTTDTVNAIVANVQVNMRAGEAAKTAAKEAVEVGKANLQMARQINNAGPPTGGALSYAAMVARGAPPAGTTNTQVTRMPPMQTQREVVVTIRDPTTVLSLRAMNPRNLDAHVERAIAQSGNENIDNIKVLSSNQLRSGDLSIKTATSNETEALKQFADDWVNRVGNRASIRITTYGVIAQNIRTSTMDVNRFEEPRRAMFRYNAAKTDVRYATQQYRSLNPSRRTTRPHHTFRQSLSGRRSSVLVFYLQRTPMPCTAPSRLPSFLTSIATCTC